MTNNKKDLDLDTVFEEKLKRLKERFPGKEYLWLLVRATREFYDEGYSYEDLYPDD